MTLERVAKAGGWSILEFAAGQGINFITIVFLARLLSPTDFGVFAFAVLTVTFFTTLITGGLSALIVQRNDLTYHDFDRIFSLALALSLAAACIIAALGPILARFYGYPALATILPMVALQPLIASFGLIPSALLNKELRLAPLAKIALASNMIAGTAAVLVAYHGYGVWALAVQMLVSATLSSLLIWRVSEHKPSFSHDIKPLYPMLRFAAPVSIAQALQIFYAQGSALILGKRYSAADVGLFNRGYGLALIPHQLFTGLIGKIALPLFSELEGDNQAIRRGMKRGSESVMLISTPAFVGLAMLAPQLIELLYGEQWIDAAPILSILALSGILMPLQSTNVHLLLAKGMSRTFFRLELTKKAVGITLVLIASFYGITAVALAYLANSLVSLFLNTRYTRSIVGLGLLEQLTHVAGIIFASGIMALTLWLFLDATEFPLVVKTLTAILVGATTYFFVGFAGGFASFRRSFRDAKNLLARAK